MTRRALIVVLACVVTGAPVAATLCEVLCATHVMTSAHTARPQHHSCHAEPAPAAGFAFTAVPHSCGHPDQSPAGLEQPPQAFAAPVAIAAPEPWSPAVDFTLARSCDVSAALSPPGPSVLPSQLRV